MNEMNVCRVERRPHLAEHIVTALSEEIASGRLRHGDRLPTEQFLAENFGRISPEEFEAAASRANTIVHDESVALGGSISAEHGIGQMHLDRLPRYAAPVELDLMRTIKRALDPKWLMNPGKVVKPD